MKILDLCKGPAYQQLDVSGNTRRTRRFYLTIIAVVLLIVTIIAVTISTVLYLKNKQTNVIVNPPNPPPYVPLTAKHGAVAADSQICSEMGVDILKLGGNAVDAAVTVCLCLGVASPVSSGIGGGAGILVRMNDGRTEFIDSRETAPAAAYRDMYLNNTMASRRGVLAIAVPAELRGLDYTWNKYKSGNLTWFQLVQPAMLLARNGYNISASLATRIKNNLQYMNDAMKAIFAPKGVPLKEGDLLVQTKLSETLEKIATLGVEVFYTGEIATNLVNDIQAEGGIITLEDLAAYQPISRPLTQTFYRGYEVIGSYPILSGGPCIGLGLNILEFYNMALLQSQNETGLATHWAIQSLLFGFSDRMALGDPNYVANISEIVGQMLDKSHAADLRKRLRTNQTFPPEYYVDLTEEVINPVDDHGTSHFSIVDSERNAVAITSTINLVFGSLVVSPSTGILLNDEMDDFSSPNSSNAFGFPPSVANFIAPGKRPLSSMSPTIILKDGDFFMAVGGSGGSTIISSVYQAIVKVIDYGFDIAMAINTPRFHDQLIPPILFVENDYPNEIKDYMNQLGYQLKEDSPIGAVQGIVQGDDGTLYAASDKRKGGVPAGY